jgi:hypothetical protein
MRVSGLTVDVEVVFSEDLGSLVDRVSGSVKDSTEHVLRDGELHGGTRELDVGGLDVDSRGSFENLHSFRARQRRNATSEEGSQRERAAGLLSALASPTERQASRIPPSPGSKPSDPCTFHLPCRRAKMTSREETDLDDSLLSGHFEDLTSSLRSIGQGEGDDLVVGSKLEGEKFERAARSVRGDDEVKEGEEAWSERVEMVAR